MKKLLSPIMVLFILLLIIVFLLLVNLVTPDYQKRLYWIKWNNLKPQIINIEIKEENGSQYDTCQIILSGNIKRTYPCDTRKTIILGNEKWLRIFGENLIKLETMMAK